MKCAFVSVTYYLNLVLEKQVASFQYPNAKSMIKYIAVNTFIMVKLKVSHRENIILNK